MGRADQLMAVRMGRQRLSMGEDKGLLDQVGVSKKIPVLVGKGILVQVDRQIPVLVGKEILVGRRIPVQVDKGNLVGRRIPVQVDKGSLVGRRIPVQVGRGFRLGQLAVDKEQMQIGVDMLAVQGSLH